MWFGLGVLLLVAVGLVIAFPGAAIVLIPLLLIIFAGLGLTALSKRRKEVKSLQEFREEAGVEEINSDKDNKTLVS
jgi:Na+-transporting methylmalonyl-CoA/oxaloacetate decarboxylase gamma subunit